MERSLSLFFTMLLLLSYVADAQSNYIPPQGAWERRAPERVGLDPAKVKAAVDFAIANEAKAPRNQEISQAQTFGREAFGDGIGLF